MKKALLFLGCLLSFTGAVAQTKPAELLLIGTFHFHNPGLDVIKTKTLDVMAAPVQAELETMTRQLAAFGPRKIFVEWPADDQTTLDTLYQAYLRGGYETYINQKYPKASDRNFYLRNEIFQLAFRAGKKAKLTRIHAFDYRKTAFPYDSVQKALAAAQQTQLQQQMEATMQAIAADQNRKMQTFTLTQLLLDTNTPQSIAENRNAYVEMFNRAGRPDNFAGPYLVSEWFRRNLYMYSIVQKTVQPTDERVVVLAGSGHTAMISDFVAMDKRFRLKELKDVLRK